MISELTAFEAASGVEKSGMLRLIPYANKIGVSVVLTDGQPFLQKVYGDFLIQRKTEHAPLFVEVKCERVNPHGNLFLEAWSNYPRATLGWMHTCRADVLWYYFIESDELYVIKFSELRKWAFDARQIYKWPLQEQGAYEQMNRTVGWLVPIDVLQRKVKCVDGPISVIPFLEG